MQIICSKAYSSQKFHGHSSTTSWVILLTDKQTNKQAWTQSINNSKSKSNGWWDEFTWVRWVEREGKWLGWGRNEAGTWFRRQSDGYWKERFVILSEEDEGGRVMVMSDEERVQHLLIGEVITYHTSISLRSFGRKEHWKEECKRSKLNTDLRSCQPMGSGDQTWPHSDCRWSSASSESVCEWCTYGRTDWSRAYGVPTDPVLPASKSQLLLISKAE